MGNNAEKLLNTYLFLHRSKGEKLQEAQEKQTLAQTLEMATDRPKSFLHLI